MKQVVLVVSTGGRGDGQSGSHSQCSCGALRGISAASVDVRTDCPAGGWAGPTDQLVAIATSTDAANHTDRAPQGSLGVGAALPVTSAPVLTHEDYLLHEAGGPGSC